MISLPSRFSVFDPDTSSPGKAGSGICFTHTITFMARTSYWPVAEAG